MLADRIGAAKVQYEHSPKRQMRGKIGSILVRWLVWMVWDDLQWSNWCGQFKWKTFAKEEL